MEKMLENSKKDRIKDFAFVLLCFVLPVIVYWRDLSQNLLMVTGDGMNIFTPVFFQAKEILTGDIPLWNSYVITGVPFFADPNNSFFYPFHALALIFPPTLYSNLYYIIHVGLAGIFTYLFLKKSSDDRFIAFIGAMTIVFSTFIGGFRREHVAVYTSIIWTPLILYFVLSFIKGGMKRDLLFSALAMTMQFFGGHPQYTFYSDFVVFLYFVYNMVAEKYSIKDMFISLSIWMGAYILFSAVFLVPVAELVMQSARFESNFFTLYSTRWEILLMTIFPRVFGDTFYPLGDYGSAEISIEVYLGIIPLIYALYAVRYHFSNRLIKFGVFAIVFSWLYSSWSNIPHIGIWLQKIPVFNFFDVQSRILFIYVFFGIFCFAYGISDLRRSELLKRLLNHNLFMVVFLVFAALIISAVRLSPMLGGDVSGYYKFTSNIFLYSILIAALNALLTGLLYFFQEKTIAFNYGVLATALVLLVVTAFDVGRFSRMHNNASFDSLVKTGETGKIQELLGDDPYRIVTVYDDYYRSVYGTSGLRDNWSMNSDIRNLKGRTEFENPNLNELLVQSESRDNHNVWNLLSEGEILSMLSVRFVLVPLGEHAPYAVPTSPETEILNEGDLVTIPGNGELYVVSYPMPVDTGRYYRVEFDVNAIGKDVDLFYVDLFGGTDYDFGEQDKVIKIKKGTNSYSTIIYAGDKPLDSSDTSFRVVSISYEPLQVSNLKVVKLIPPVENPDYVPVAQTDNYTIYENSRAQKMLYIPEQVVNIKDAAKLRMYPYNYPGMDRISYVEGLKGYQTDGELDILSVTNNSLTAHVSSEEGTFVNHSQSFYPGWKAFIDEQPVSIYLVNGVIQGTVIPPGDHIVKFVYDPLSLKIGAFISVLAYFAAFGYIMYESLKLKPRTVE